MPAVMFTVVQTWCRYGRAREVYVTLPWVTALVREPETPQRYFVLPDEEPTPAVKTPSRGGGCWGARPRQGGREVIPLDE